MAGMARTREGNGMNAARDSERLSPQDCPPSETSAGSDPVGTAEEHVRRASQAAPNTPSAATMLVCVRHGEIRLHPPIMYRDLWRCPYCGIALVTPTVKAANDALKGIYLRA